MSPKSIASESVRPCISPELGAHFKTEVRAAQEKEMFLGTWQPVSGGFPADFPSVIRSTPPVCFVQTIARH
jgi:hypothetical protein